MARGPRPPRPRRDVRHVQPVSRAVAGHQARHDARRRLRRADRLVRLVGPSDGDPRGRSGRGRARRRPAARRPGRRRPRRSATPAPVPGHRRLAVPVPADREHRAVLPCRARIPADLRPGRGARRRTGDEDAAPPVQPALLRARDRVPAARDQEPRLVQPAVRHDLGGQRPGLLRHPRQRPAGHRGQPVAEATQSGPVLRRPCSSHWPSPTSSRRTPC